jgi:hypothetical protein
LPPKWEALPANRSGASCSFGIQPIGWKAIRARSTIQLSEVAVTITVSSLSLDDAATTAGFMTVAELRRRVGEEECETLAPETWLLPGGRGSRTCNQVQQVSGGEFRGIAGESSYGRMKKGSGYYAGLGEFSVAAVTNGSLTVVVEDGAEASFEKTILPLVRSLSTSGV